MGSKSGAWGNTRFNTVYKRFWGCKARLWISVMILQSATSWQCFSWTIGQLIPVCSLLGALVDQNAYIEEIRVQKAGRTPEYLCIA